MNKKTLSILRVALNRQVSHLSDAEFQVALIEAKGQQPTWKGEALEQYILSKVADRRHRLATIYMRLADQECRTILETYANVVRACSR
jgi:hypothetical protein